MTTAVSVPSDDWVAIGSAGDSFGVTMSRNNSTYQVFLLFAASKPLSSKTRPAPGDSSYVLRDDQPGVPIYTGAGVTCWARAESGTQVVYASAKTIPPAA